MSEDPRLNVLSWTNDHSYMHRLAFMYVAGIPDDGSTRSERDVRTLLAWLIDSLPCELWPVWERPGWWTTTPSEEVRLVSEYRTAVQDATKYARRGMRLRRFRPGTGLQQTVALHSAMTLAYLSQLEDLLPAPDRDDFCLNAIDRLVAQGLWEGT